MPIWIMPAMKKRGGTYELAPEVPAELAKRVSVVIATLAGQQTVSGGARELGLSRVAFQTVTHRALRGLLDAVTPRPPGPAPEPDLVRALRAENERLRLQLAQTEEQLAMFQRFMGVASDLLHGRKKLRGRGGRASRSTSTASSTPSSPPPDSEPEPVAAASATATESTSPSTTIPSMSAAEVAAAPEGRRRELLDWSRRARAAGMTVPVIGALLGIGPSTLSRWERRALAGKLLYSRRGAAIVPEAVALRVAKRVRATHGLIGVQALRHSVAPGIPRRAIAALKRATVIEMERARQEGCGRVEVTTPGIVRGLDAMEVRCAEGKRWVLVCADAAVPYRTTMVLVEHYDADTVLRVLLADFIEHGAPLVLRMDRARCQRTAEIAEMVEREGVQVLHGPARHPQYYGQLERQNREHRAWLSHYETAPAAVVAAAVADMRQVMNALWPRPSLGWSTPEAAWTARPPVRDNRRVLNQEVQDRAARIAANDNSNEVDELTARRFAIETALSQRGYLEIKTGTKC